MAKEVKQRVEKLSSCGYLMVERTNKDLDGCLVCYLHKFMTKDSQEKKMLCFHIEKPKFTVVYAH